MNDFKVVKGDDIYLSIKNVRKKDLGGQFTAKYIPLNDFIETVNFVNSYGEHLDIRMADFKLELYDTELKEVVADYDIDFDLYRSVGEYCWSRIKA